MTESAIPEVILSDHDDPWPESRRKDGKEREREKGYFLGFWATKGIMDGWREAMAGSLMMFLMLIKVL